MTDRERSDTAWDDAHAVRLRVPAAVEQLAVIRAAAAAVAASWALGPTEIADTRLAVTEAATELMARAVPGTAIECQFTGETGRICIEFAITVRPPYATSPLDHSTSWLVLQAITNHLTTSTLRSPGDEQQLQTRVRFHIDYAH